ncbi:transposase family protein [Methylobacterium sp. 1030]|uniref:transposase family protein n=1 Tax=Methylobacterium sp. 1030 TaxID=3156404 RepID=UPI00339265B0
MAAFLVPRFVALHLAGQDFALAAFGIAFMATRFLGSPAVDHFGARRVLVVAFCVEATGLAGLALARTAAPAFACTALTGAALAMLYPVRPARGAGIPFGRSPREGTVAPFCLQCFLGADRLSTPSASWFSVTSCGGVGGPGPGVPPADSDQDDGRPSPPMPKRLLPFIPPSLRVVAVTAKPEHVMVLAVPRSTEPCCPACSNRSDSVHGTYERHLADLPCQGRSVGLCVRLRRLRCRNPACHRRTFSDVRRHGKLVLPQVWC